MAWIYGQCSRNVVVKGTRRVWQRRTLRPYFYRMLYRRMKGNTQTCFFGNEPGQSFLFSVYKLPSCCRDVRSIICPTGKYQTNQLLKNKNEEMSVLAKRLAMLIGLGPDKKQISFCACTLESLVTTFVRMWIRRLTSRRQRGQATEDFSTFTSVPVDPR